MGRRDDVDGKKRMEDLSGQETVNKAFFIFEALEF